MTSSIIPQILKIQHKVTQIQTPNTLKSQSPLLSKSAPLSQVSEPPHLLLRAELAGRPRQPPGVRPLQQPLQARSLRQAGHHSQHSQNKIIVVCSQILMNKNETKCLKIDIFTREL